MNRRTYQFHSAFEAQTVALYMNVQIGAAGAPTLTSNENKGIASITRDSAGVYTIALQDSYTRLLAADLVVLSSAVATVPDMTILDDNSADLDSPSIQIQLSSAGVSVDPASGEVLLIHMQMKNSSI